jgi:hypothetical protein
MRGTRLIVIVIATSIAAAAGVASMPSLGASAEPSATPDVIRLHLGTDARKFTFDGATQSINVGKNSCAITSPQGSLIALSSSITSGGTQSVPGLSNYGLGVKASPSSGNGSPCAQVDPVERLLLRPGSTLQGRTFSSLQFDLELTGNAIAVITVSRGTTQSETYNLLTGTSITADQLGEPGYDSTAPYTVESGPGDQVDACAAPNSSGPNSAGNDNCEWKITPSFNFDTIRLTTTIGTVTLEGGADFANDPLHDSLFLLSNAAPIAVDDSAEVDQDESVVIDALSNDTDADGDLLTATIVSGPSSGSVTPLSTNGSFTYTPGANFSGTDSFTYTASDGIASSNEATVSVNVCTTGPAPDSDGDVTAIFDVLSVTNECKRYTVDAVAIDPVTGGGTVLFVPQGEATVNYRGYLTFEPQEAPAAGGTGVLNLLLEYAPDGLYDFQPVLWCINPQFDPTGTVTGATLPPGESWCIASEASRGNVDGDVGTTWQVFGTDDPRFQ